MLPPQEHQDPVSTYPVLDGSSSDPFNDASTPSVTQPEAWLKDQLQSSNRANVASATDGASKASSDHQSLNSSMRTFVESQSTCTPHGARANLKYAPNSKRDEHKKEVAADLGTVIDLDDSGEWARSLYVDLVKKDEIDKFLAETNVYTIQSADSKYWVDIPEDDGTGKLEEFHLYGPYCKLFNLILQWFVHKIQDGTEAGEASSREAIDTHDVRLGHQEPESTTLTSRPDISVKATGDSFQVPEAKSGNSVHRVGFSNISSFKEIKLERQNYTDRDQWLQVGVYSRQMLIQQPNRRFVRALLLTENDVRLFHFDRSGGMYSPFINIHDEPEVLIRLVVGLNSANEEDIGLDTSIKWSIKDGRKVSGTLTARKAAGTSQISYNLCEVDPIVTYYSIRGRATQCWSVSDPDTGIRYLIKDCWKDETRVSEHVYLEEAKDLAGVAQMVSFEPNRGETKFLRGGCGISHEDFHNRIAIRIVLNSYGDSIENFKSAKQLLRALRDAIIGKFGHMELYMKGVLHRDVSIANILLGKKGDGSEPPPGFCGVLIDLHMAIKVGRDIAERSADWRSGSSLFQSIAVLLSCIPIQGSREIPPPLAQDHLDDLESFFYIYTYIIYVHGSNGDLLPFESDVIVDWKNRELRHVAKFKKSFFTDKFVPEEIIEAWPKSCIELLNNFQDWIAPYATTKRDRVLRNRQGSANVQEFKALMEGISSQYRQVIRLFNTAILELEIDDRNGGFEPNDNQIDTEMYVTRFKTPPLELPSSAPTSPVGYPEDSAHSPLAKKVLERNAREYLKRYPEEDPDDVPEAKRGPETPQTPQRKSTVPSEGPGRPVKRKNHLADGGSPLAKL